MSKVVCIENINLNSTNDAARETHHQIKMGLLSTRQKIAIVKFGGLCLGLFYTFWVILACPFLWILRGNKLFTTKERKVEPQCLQDPKYGRHQHIQLSAIKMHYVENGDRNKPLMLCLHGFPEFWFSWRHQLVQFASTHWVVAVDMRGYGETDKPRGHKNYSMKYLEKDICDLIQRLTKDKCILVAHDWGGVVAWNVAAFNPQLIDKLIIMNAPIVETVRYKMRTSIGQFLKSWYVCFFQAPYFPEFGCRLNDMEIFHWIFLNEHKKLFLPEEDLEGFKYTFSKEGAWTEPMNYYRQNLHKFLVSDGSAKFPKIDIPTLFIWGEDDIALSRDYPELSRRYVTNLTIKYIPKGNHYIQQDKPDIVNAHMSQFLNIKS